MYSFPLTIGSTGYFSVLAAGPVLEFWAFDPGTCSGGNLRHAEPALILNNTDQELQSVKIYPNPAANAAALTYILDADQTGYIELYSVMGQKVGSYQLQSSGTTRIDLSNIPAGVYFVNVKVNGEAKYSDKLIVDNSIK